MNAYPDSSALTDAHVVSKIWQRAYNNPDNNGNLRQKVTKDGIEIGQKHANQG